MGSKTGEGAAESRFLKIQDDTYSRMPNIVINILQVYFEPTVCYFWQICASSCWFKCRCVVRSSWCKNCCFQSRFPGLSLEYPDFQPAGDGGGLGELAVHGDRVRLVHQHLLVRVQVVKVETLWTELLRTGGILFIFQPLYLVSGEAASFRGCTTCVQVLQLNRRSLQWPTVNACDQIWW